MKVNVSVYVERKEWQTKTYVTRVVHTSGYVELVSRSPGKQIRDRSTSRVPAAERRGSVPISQLPLKSVAPSFSISGVTAVEHGPIHPVDILLDVSTSPDVLWEKLIFGDT